MPRIYCCISAVVVVTVLRTKCEYVRVMQRVNTTEMYAYECLNQLFILIATALLRQPRTAVRVATYGDKHGACTSYTVPTYDAKHGVGHADVGRRGHCIFTVLCVNMVSCSSNEVHHILTEYE